MKRLKLIFATILILLILPVWRLVDLVAITSPFEIFLTFALTFWFGVFVMVPLKLIFPSIKSWALVAAIAIFGTSSYFLGSFSRMAVIHPELNHCGHLTFTGTFYSLRGILTEAYRDDLEARNQLCWMRKMITKVPQAFDNENDFTNYSQLLQGRLLKPEIKFRVTLPLIAILYIRLNATWGDTLGVKRIYDSLHFWIDQYTEEISQRTYPAWNWPHSAYIKWEYGFIERNWQELVDSIVLEEK